MLSVVLEIIKTSMFVLGALLPIVNPLGNAPVFLSLTGGYSVELRNTAARKIATNGFILLVVSILVGTHVLHFFGISLPVVQVGGGLVVMATGWTLLNQKDEQPKSEKLSSVDVSKRAFYPLTLPLTVGPGSISVAITLGANVQKRANPELLATALIAPLLVGICYRFAENLRRLFGEVAMNVILRLSSFILLCIGVQILWNGVRELLGKS